ncbi:hypothetical protein SLEP1_g36662 [Rubroshorea leprosula]|uniref:Uncharacterized protein n=1 Tax=Rubroshorea leprosula TaxID=152421 RepID=A0AAV5KS60_9ROSI|nr:hypothetical protein SLEP1_g36662 [Rubroshorea leprosula]
MAIIERPILSRLDILDNVVRQLEEIRGYNNKSAKSSCESSGTLSSDGQYPSSSDVSPKWLEKHCRPIDDVLMEIEAKGTLIDRLHHLEDRVLKVCLQLEEELEAEKRREDENENEEKKLHSHKKGIKQLVKHCVKGKPTKHKAR